MKINLLVVIVLGLSAFLRLYQLVSVPPSLDWDEVSLGYNAYSILKTGSDEYGNFLPFSIRSFNDYKPPLYVYLTIPSIAIFGLTEFAVRLPSALMGILAVGFVFLLVTQIFPDSKKYAKLYALSTLLFVFSPWHLQFSRGAFEANIALTCYLGFLSFFMVWVNTKPRQMLWLMGSAVWAAFCLYAYHSARMIIPLTALGLFILYKKELFSHTKQTTVALMLGVLLIVPLGVITLRGSASQRFAATGIFTNPGEFSRERERLERAREFKAEDSIPFSWLHSQKIVFAQLITRNYFEHFNFDFLFLRGDGNPRHHVPGMGLLYLFEIPLIIFGVYNLARSEIRHKYVVFMILVLGPSASALTASTPHAIRSLMMMPALSIFSGLGALGVVELIQSQKRYINIILYPVTCILLLINLAFYFNSYYVIYPHISSKDWQSGYKELVLELSMLEGQYDRVLVTNKYDQPHIFFAFYKQIHPRLYQPLAETAHQRLESYQFKNIKFPEDNYPNTLYATDPDSTPSEVEILKQIKFNDGTVAFNVFGTNDEQETMNNEK